MFQSRFFVCAVMIFIAALSRIAPHPQNFSPIMAIALFSGAQFVDKKGSILVPILAWFISDMFLGFHALQPVIYALVIGMVMIGWTLKNNLSSSKVFGFSLLGSVIFFLVTNFFVWARGDMYALDMNGFIQCYIMAVPFFQNTILGDLLFNVVLFGSMYLLESRGYIRKVQTA